MYRLFLSTCCLLGLILSTFVSPIQSHSERRDASPTKLRPIHITDYEAAIGLRRREADSFSSLNLQTQSELFWGSPGDKGQLLMANMTLYAPDGLLMVMMERFEPLTSAVDCKGDDGAMSLTFQSEDAFQHALKQWSFINENDDGKFLLIANHDGCGPDDRRQPYFISQITESPSTLTTHLTAHPAPFSSIASTYSLDFGHSTPYHAPSLNARGLWGAITNVGKTVLDAAQGNADLTKAVTFPISIGARGQKTNIYTDDKGRLTLDCVNCFVSGTFHVTGHISVQGFELQDLTLAAVPQGVQAEMELEATVTSSESSDSLQYTKELFSFPVPDAGIEVPGIFKLGATLSYDIGISSSFSGSATVDFGLQAGLPDSAQLVADIQNPDASSANGLSIGDVSPIFDIKKESASLSVSAFSQPKLAFGIELTEVGDIDVAITIKLPEISSTLSAEYDEGGVCAQSAGAAKTGVKVENKVDVSVDLQIDAHLGSGEETAKPSWSKKLWGVEKGLGGMCFPMDIPGLQGSASSSSASGSATLKGTSSGMATVVSPSPTGTGSTSAESSAIASSSPAAPSSSSSTADTPDNQPKKAAPVHPHSTTPAASSSSTLKTSAKATTSAEPETSSSAADQPTITSAKKTPSSTRSSSAIASTSSAESGGGGGCRMVRRFGKRMLVC